MRRCRRGALQPGRAHTYLALPYLPPPHLCEGRTCRGPMHPSASNLAANDTAYLVLGLGGNGSRGQLELERHCFAFSPQLRSEPVNSCVHARLAITHTHAQSESAVTLSVIGKGRQARMHMGTLHVPLPLLLPLRFPSLTEAGSVSQGRGLQQSPTSS